MGYSMEMQHHSSHPFVPQGTAPGSLCHLWQCAASAKILPRLLLSLVTWHFRHLHTLKTQREIAVGLLRRTFFIPFSGTWFWVHGTHTDIQSITRLCRL